MTTGTVSAFEEPRIDLWSESPRVAHAMVALQRTIELDETVRELVKVRASILNGCAYCVDMHTKDARLAGEPEQRLYALAAWQEAPFFSDRERAALALTDAVTLVADGHVPREVFDEAARHFDPAELAQLIWQIAAINVWNRVAITARMRPGEYDPAARNGRRST